jgi:nitronate monooxygenase
MANGFYKRMLIESQTKDVVCTPFFTGVRANYLLPSIVAAGIDPKKLMTEKPDIDLSGGEAKAWKNIWSGGHGVFATKQIVSTAELVADLHQQYVSVER